jgi:4a-hydroxytetrahydrobiopterin dehydratase
MWQDKNNSLYRKFEFKDFEQAFAFMQKVAELAEQTNHHPKWLNEWNKVEIWLSTHEAGNKVTDKDKELATKIDKVYRGE